MAVNKKYTHTEKLHNLDSPSEIVPVLCELFSPKSVLDVGCGLGTFLHCFKQQGVKKVLGIDGDWADKGLISKHLEEDEFLVKNLEKPLILDQRFDLALTLEVAEHLSEKAADTFVESLVSLSDTIIFSAAIPEQGGDNHINEQWPFYWHEKFLKHDYIIRDVLRPIFWNNPKVYWWYKQNMFVFTKRGKKIDNKALKKFKKSPMLHAVHPELFMTKIRQYNRLLKNFNKLKNQK